MLLGLQGIRGYVATKSAASRVSGIIYSLTEITMPLIFIDTETRSGTPIAQGLSRYTADPNFTVLLVSYAIDDGDVQLWDRTLDKTCPQDLLEALLDPASRLIAHNAVFDQTVLRKSNVFPLHVDINLNRWCCTEAMARSHGMPAALFNLSRVLLGGDESEEAKIDGRKYIKMFTIPADPSGRFHSPVDNPVDWAGFCTYAKQDIVSLRGIYHKLPRWNYPGIRFPAEPSAEYAHWLRQCQINERGIPIDLRFASRAVELSLADKVELKAKAMEATDGAVSAATQRDKLLKHLVEVHGVTLPDLAKGTIEKRLNDPSLPEAVKDILRIRLDASQNAASKYKALLECTSRDGRLRNTLVYCGAGATGRLSGRLFQPQNLKRPSAEQEEIDLAIETIRAGEDVETDSVATLLGDCVRGAIMASNGHTLVASDLSSVEARVLAWLAGETSVLDFYEGLDTGDIKHDAYVDAYAQAFNISPDAVTKPQRQIGKAMVLGLGFGGGVSAFLTFAQTVGIDLKEMANAVMKSGDRNGLAEARGKYDWAKENNYHAGLDEQTYAACEYLKTVWRDSRPATVDFWSHLEAAVRNALVMENKAFAVGKHIAVKRIGEYTLLRLPSGRVITIMRLAADAHGALTHWTWSEYSRSMERQPLYGGKLSGWVTQATARDILTWSLPRIERAGFPVIMTVHDEVVTEVVTLSRSHEQLSELVAAGETWTKGLPLSAEGWEAKRYRK